MMKSRYTFKLPFWFDTDHSCSPRFMIIGEVDDKELSCEASIVVLMHRDRIVTAKMNLKIRVADSSRYFIFLLSLDLETFKKLSQHSQLVLS